MDSSRFSYKRTISLSNGAMLEFDYDDQFDLVLRRYFELGSADTVTDAQIVYYLRNAVSNAVEKAEKDEIS